MLQGAKKKIAPSKLFAPVLNVRVVMSAACLAAVHSYTNQAVFSLLVYASVLLIWNALTYSTLTEIYTTLQQQNQRKNWLQCMLFIR